VPFSNSGWTAPGRDRRSASWSDIPNGRRDAEQPLKAWHALAKAANWSQPNEIKAKFSTASFLANNRVVFNISSNKYRLVVKVVYELKTIYVRFIGSHADYDRIDASTI
jgi:mRNA interferase HigB